jgi:hypothetical protein
MTLKIVFSIIFWFFIYLSTIGHYHDLFSEKTKGKIQISKKVIALGSISIVTFAFCIYLKIAIDKFYILLFGSDNPEIDTQLRQTILADLSKILLGLSSLFYSIRWYLSEIDRPKKQKVLLRVLSGFCLSASLSLSTFGTIQDPLPPIHFWLIALRFFICLFTFLGLLDPDKIKPCLEDPLFVKKRPFTIFLCWIYMASPMATMLYFVISRYSIANLNN